MVKVGACDRVCSQTFPPDDINYRTQPLISEDEGEN